MREVYHLEAVSGKSVMGLPRHSACSGMCVFRFELFVDVVVLNGEGPARCDVLVQRLEALLFVRQVFRSPDELLHGFYVKKLIDVVVVSQKIRWDVAKHPEYSDLVMR